MSHYDVLGVGPDAHPAELRRAYLELARRHHPDRSGGDPARMRAINEAWATLGDPARRRRYDLTLAEPGRSPTAGWTAAAGGAPEGRHDADDEDDRPYRMVGPSSGWFALIPVGLFAASIGVALLGLLLGFPGLVGASVLVFALSCLAFLAAPILSLYASRRGTGAGGARPPQ